MFSRLGNWCHDHRRLVLGLWVAAFLIGGALQAAGNSFRDEFNLPDSESRTGFDILDDHFGGEGTGINGTIVYQEWTIQSGPVVPPYVLSFTPTLDYTVPAAGVYVLRYAAVNAIEELEQTAKLLLLLEGQPTRYLTPRQVLELNRRFKE